MNVAPSPRAEPRLPVAARVVIIAMPREHVAPIRCGSHVLQRMQVMSVDRTDAPALLAAPTLPAPRLLPHINETEPNGRRLLFSRRLQGEILCDESGHFYEKMGHIVRPLNQLVAGPHGDIIDVAPEPREAPPGWPAADERPEVGAASVPCRALFPAAGRRSLVRFGDFKAALAALLARPERLRDSHTLVCRVRVFEVLHDAPADAVRAAALGSAAAGELYLLTWAGAERLGLSDVLPPTKFAAAGERAPGRLRRGDHVFHLTVESDPTKDAPAPAAPLEGERPPRANRRAIPERYLSPWEFALSRDEALYEMRTRPSWFRSLLTRFAHPIAERAALRKWYALMAGKTPDDQLWSVRPPRHALVDPAIREWVRQMLASAGYDAGVMFTEWEIFWRRKRR